MVVVKVPKTSTVVTNVCMIEYGVGATGVDIEVTVTELTMEADVKSEVALVVTGVVGF